MSWYLVSNFNNIYIYIYIYILYKEREEERGRKGEGFFPGIMAKVLDCGLEVREFKLQPCYYVHFQTNTIR